MSTGCLHTLPPEGIAEAAREAGFGHLEVLLNPDLMDNIAAMAEAMDARGLKATVAHAPFSLDGIISTPGSRGDALSLGVRALDAAAAGGSPVLTIHPGSAAPRGSGRQQEYVETANENIDALQAMAAERGMELLVENTSAAYLLGIKVSGLLGNTPDEIA